MSLPHGLEKLILKGKATFRIHNHAFSSFGTIPIPNNNTVIITHVKWYPFLNPFVKPENIFTITWKQLFQFNEYQLKIDAKKSTNFLIYRNEQLFQFWNGLKVPSINALITQDTWSQFVVLQSKPIDTDVYFICEEHIKLTISRNCYVDKIADDFNPISSPANEMLPPKGIKGLNVVRTARLTAPNGETMVYIPAGYKDVNFGVFTDLQTKTTYGQPINSANGLLQSIEEMEPFSIYKTTPLIEFSYVLINTDEFNKLLNS